MLSDNFYFNETQDVCKVCNKAIMNPLCPFCLADEIEAWLTLYPNLKEKLHLRLNKYLRGINSQITNYGAECIKCKKNRAFVCAYCFTEYVFEELIEINAEKIILREFFEFFNFDFSEEYKKEIQDFMPINYKNEKNKLLAG